MRIRKRNNVIYWLGFSIFFVPLIMFTILFIFGSGGFDISDDLIVSKYANYVMSIYDIDGVTEYSFYSFGSTISYLSSFPLFNWVQNIDALLPDLQIDAFGSMIICFIYWVLIYNEIWLFIRVFLWFFDIPNELLERSVNIV